MSCIRSNAVLSGSCVMCTNQWVPHLSSSKRQLSVGICKGHIYRVHPYLHVLRMTAYNLGSLKLAVIAILSRFRKNNSYPILLYCQKYFKFRSWVPNHHYMYINFCSLVRDCSMYMYVCEEEILADCNLAVRAKLLNLILHNNIFRLYSILCL